MTVRVDVKLTFWPVLSSGWQQVEEVGEQGGPGWPHQEQEEGGQQWGPGQQLQEVRH